MRNFKCGLHDGEDEPLPRLIYLTAQNLRNIGEKTLAPHDLTIEQLHPLKIISFSPGITQRQIGDECNKSAANLTRILDRLQKKSLIERRNNPDDRRASLVFLTKEGESLIAKVTELFDSLTEKVVAGICHKDQQIIRQSLHKMAANLEKLDLEFQTK
jgi:DNA-binding MarR family transcriptional regulator